MLTVTDYLELKSRMLLAAEAAALIARGNDTVRFDEEMYPRVLAALAANKDDVRKVLAECDILRNLSQQSIFPTPASMAGAANASSRVPNDTGTVDPVQDPPNETGGEEVQSDNAANSGPVPAKRAVKRRKPRSKSGGDRAGEAADPAAVGRTDAAGAVGGDEGTDDNL